MARLWTAALLALFAISAQPTFAQERPRLALLLANQDYPTEPGALRRPHADADALAAALAELAFDVTVVRDADAEGMEAAIADFAIALSSAGPDAVGFFYFAGHGAVATVRGERRNFMLPSGAPVATAVEAAQRGVNFERQVDALEAAGAGIMFVVYDACRNTLTRAAGVRGFQPHSQRSGLLIAMSTMEDQTTPDDGAYAMALAREIRRPGVEAEAAFLAAGRAVAAGRVRTQMPTLASGLPERFCFAGCDAPVFDLAAIDRDLSDWERASAEGSFAAFRTYLTANPDGRFRAAAQALLAARSAGRGTDEQAPDVRASLPAAPPPQPVSQIVQADPNRCSLATAPQDAEILVVSVYEGAAISSSYLSTPEEETQVVDLVIEPGDRPLYLIATSYESVIWRLAGATRRLAQIAVVTHAGDPARPAGGVASAFPLPPLRLFHASVCFSHVTDAQAAGVAEIQGVLRQEIGRPADRVIAAYEAMSIATTGGVATDDAFESPPAFPGFDAATWAEAVRFAPAGLAYVPPAEIIGAAAGSYEAPPHFFGLAYYVARGVLERLPETTPGQRVFGVARPFSLFPAGLSGSRSVTFVVRPGTPAPFGSPGHSCIVFSATGREQDGGDCADWQ